MTFYKKIGVSPTAYKIEQVRDDGLIRFVDADHAGFLAWRAAGNVPEEIPYVAPIIPPTEIEFIDDIKVENVAFVGDALAAIGKIAANARGEIDLNTLPEYAQSVDRVGGKKKIRRDPEKMISLLTAAVKQLLEK